VEVNNMPSSEERFISTADSKIKVMVIPTNEELMIAMRIDKGIGKQLEE
jgi:acetate kinase